MNAGQPTAVLNGRVGFAYAAVLRAGVALRGVTELKSFETPLTELVTCPLTAPKVLAARPILLSKAGQASCNSIRRYSTHSCVHVTAASISDASLRFLPLAAV